MMDVLSGVLTGSSYATGVVGPYVADRRSGCGHLVLALRVDAVIDARGVRPAHRRPDRADQGRSPGRAASGDLLPRGDRGPRRGRRPPSRGRPARTRPSANCARWPTRAASRPPLRLPHGGVRCTRSWSPSTSCPSHVDEFLTGIRANATASLRDEPGCLRFDVHRSVDDACRFVLYEIYRDRAAFTDDHRAAPHYAAWRTVAARCVDRAVTATRSSARRSPTTSRNASTGHRAHDRRSRHLRYRGRPGNRRHHAPHPPADRHRSGRPALQPADRAGEPAAPRGRRAGHRRPGSAPCSTGAPPDSFSPRRRPAARRGSSCTTPTAYPTLVDLAAMRDATAELGADPARVNPTIPVELVVDHSVIADVFGTRRRLRPQRRDRVRPQRRALPLPQVGPASPCATSRSSRRAPGSCTRSTSSTCPASSWPTRDGPTPTCAWAPTRTPRWSTAWACSPGASAASKPRRRCWASRCRCCCHP